MDKLESRAAEVDAVIVKLTKKIESLEKQLAERPPHGRHSSRRNPTLPAPLLEMIPPEARELLNREHLKEEIEEIMHEDETLAPTFLRLAWHSCGTYSKHDKSGGSHGGRIRHHPEIKWGANAGLESVIKMLEPIKKHFPQYSYADLYVFSGVVAIEFMHGPRIPFWFGRTDEPDGAKSPADGRLPDADKDGKAHEFGKTSQHMRDVFYRMGFNDREIVALLGAHSVGRGYPDRSGYDGAWNTTPNHFSNHLFDALLAMEPAWQPRDWKGPMQYNVQGIDDIMMMPADMALIKDPVFRKHVLEFNADEALFFSEFATAFAILIELGVPRAADHPAMKYHRQH